MGIEMTPRNIKLGEKAEKQLSELQDMFSPFCANRSATVRTAINLLHVILTTPGIIEKLGVLLQGVQCVFFVRAISPSKEDGHPGPVRLAEPRRTGTSSYCVTASVELAALFHPGQKDRNAWGITPFLSGVRARLAQ